MEILAASLRSSASSPRLSDGAEGVADALAAFESVYATASDEESDGRAEPEAEERLALLTIAAKPVISVESLALGADGGASMLWSLISPCSDADEDDPSAQRFFPDEEEEAAVDSDAVRGHEDTIEQVPVSDDQVAAADGCDGDDEAGDGRDSDSEEEVQVLNAESFWAAVERPPPGELAWWPDSDKEEEEEDDGSESSCDHQPEEGHCAPRSSCDTVDSSAVVATTPIWGRLKARSYAGATSAGVQAAVASMKHRARTISSLAASSSTRHVEDDDGDFSSDDEDCRRKSDLHDLRANSQWQRRQSFAFAARLSVAAPSIDSLRSVRGKFGHKLHLFRSSSSNTVTSEESFLDSPSGNSFGSAAAGEIKSAPASLHLSAGYSAGGKRATTCSSRLNSSSSSLHVPKNLRAGVSKAAGYLNAASVEAARKLKAKTTTLRAQRKPEASETEEEELDAASAGVASDDVAMAADHHVDA